jgi:hypothetical protein
MRNKKLKKHLLLPDFLGKKDDQQIILYLSLFPKVVSKLENPITRKDGVKKQKKRR